MSVLLHDYLAHHNLPNTFATDFFMTDFELNIRNAFRLFWPDVTLVGCYFHFSQLIWRRVKGKFRQELFKFICNTMQHSSHFKCSL